MADIISAHDYFSEHKISLGGPECGGPQPSNRPRFKFGNQPAATYGKDAIPTRDKILLIGCGDVFRTFLRPALEHRFWPDENPGVTRVYVFDKQPGLELPEWAEQLPYHDLGNLGRHLPDDIKYAIIITPPEFHADGIEFALTHGIPFAVEKPLTADPVHLKKIEHAIYHSDKPCFFMDWAVHLATPLKVALGIPTPFPDAIDPMITVQSEKFIPDYGGEGFNFVMKDGEGFAKFNVSEIVSGKARYVEGQTDNPNEGSGAEARFQWLKNYRKGGGMIFDLNTHLTTTLEDMGFELPANEKYIHKVVLGIPTGTPGIYRHITDQDTGEMYARIDATMIFRGQEIPFQFEVAKGADKNDMGIELTDSSGNVLSLSFLPNILWLYNSRGEKLAGATMRIDPYAEILELMDIHLCGEEPVALYFKEHTASIEASIAMHQIGRRGKPSPAPIRQLALEKQDGTLKMDLGGRRAFIIKG